MPRYFFHTADGSVHRDGKGMELRDEEATRDEAVRLAGNCMAEQSEILRETHNLRVDVTDQNGETVVTVLTIAVDGPRYWRRETTQGRMASRD